MAMDSMGDCRKSARSFFLFWRDPSLQTTAKSCFFGLAVVAGGPMTALTSYVDLYQGTLVGFWT